MNTRLRLAGPIIALDPPQGEYLQPMRHIPALQPQQLEVREDLFDPSVAKAALPRGEPGCPTGW
jgi:hypothetical protein